MFTQELQRQTPSSSDWIQQKRASSIKSTFATPSNTGSFNHIASANGTQLAQMKAIPAQMQETGGKIEDEENIQLKAEGGVIQACGCCGGTCGGDGKDSKSVANNTKKGTAQASSSSGGQLPEMVQAKMEHAFGADFSNVKIHTNSIQAKAANALAFTQGNNIHFAPTQFKPNTTQGQELIGHELTHIIQQREGRVSATRQFKRFMLNDDPALEREADVMGKKAAQAKFSPNLGSSTPIQRKTSGSSSNIGVIQRVTHGPETPCNCHDFSIGMPPWLAGTFAHHQISDHFGIRETAIPRADKAHMANPNPGPNVGYGRADLWQKQSSSVGIAEIKSTTSSALAAPEAAHYILRHNQWMSRGPFTSGVSTQDDYNYFRNKMDFRLLPSNVLDLSGRTGTGVAVGPFRGDPRKTLNVEADSAGAVVYWCTGNRRRRQPQDQPVTVPQGERERETQPHNTPVPVVPVVPPALVRKATWSHFWKAVVKRFAIRGGAMAAMSAADGPLPVGELLSLGLTIWTIGEILYYWDDIWQEAETMA